MPTIRMGEEKSLAPFDAREENLGTKTKIAELFKYQRQRAYNLTFQSSKNSK